MVFAVLFYEFSTSTVHKKRGGDVVFINFYGRVVALDEAVRFDRPDNKITVTVSSQRFHICCYCDNILINSEDARLFEGLVVYRNHVLILIVKCYLTNTITRYLH